MRREANAAVGDQLDEKIEEFFQQCEERQRINGGAGSAAANQAAAHPPVVYVRNALNNL
jgi:hypothetical protein